MKLSFIKVAAAPIIALAVMTTIQVRAEEIELGQPAYGGSGCPSGSASAVLSPDAKALSIIFDQYSVEAGSAAAKSFERKSCNLAIPVRVPGGYSVSVFQVDYRGFVAIPSGGRGQFNVEYFFAGARGPRQVKSFFGPSSDNYNLTSHLQSEQMVWSPCGADTNLRVNTSMLVQTNSRREQSVASVDSADVTAGIVYHIQYRRCY